MAMTVKLWMLILSLSGSLVPGKDAVKLTLQLEDGSAQTFVAQAEKGGWEISLLDEKTYATMALARLTRTGTEV